MSFDIKYDKEGQPLPMRSQAPLPEIQEPVVTRDETSHVVPDESVRTELSRTQNEEVESEPVEASENDSSDIDVPVVQESSRERNLRVLREAKEEAERDRAQLQRERDEAFKKIREFEERARKPDTEDNESGPEDFQLGDDDLTEGRHYKKMHNEIKNLKKELDQYKKSSHTQSIESRIKSEFPDFERVVTPENIAILKRIKPRQAALLDQSKDLYTTASNAYEMIKEYGIYEAERDDYMKNKNLAQKNLSKPKTVTSLAPNKGESPLHRANLFAEGLTPQLATQLHKEMMESTKGR